MDKEQTIQHLIDEGQKCDKKEKTIEKMVQELDEKFEGFSCLFFNVEPIGGLPFKVFEKGNYEFFMYINLYSSSCKLGFVRCSVEGVEFKKKTLEEVVTKAHHYFITQGNEL